MIHLRYSSHLQGNNIFRISPVTICGWGCFALEVRFSHAIEPSRWAILHVKLYGTETKPLVGWSPLAMFRLSQDTYQVEKNSLGIKMGAPDYMPVGFVLTHVPDGLIEG